MFPGRNFDVFIAANPRSHASFRKNAPACFKSRFNSVDRSRRANAAGISLLKRVFSASSYGWCIAEKIGPDVIYFVVGH